MASTFSWGGQDWGYGDLAAFKSYLAAHGTAYSTWAGNHPAAADLLEIPPPRAAPAPQAPPAPAPQAPSAPSPQASSPSSPSSPSAPAASAAAASAPAAQSFSWGGRTWAAGDLYTFIAYLSAHGASFDTWAANHPDAAAVFQIDSSDPTREPQSHSLGQALAAAIQGGDTPAEAAARAEALRAALVAEGLVAVTPAQLLQDAKVVASTIAAEQGQPPPADAPILPPDGDTGGRSLESVDGAARDFADLRNLPTVPYGVKVIYNGLVTEAAIAAAALIEGADIWVTIGTCKVESGFNLEHGKNSAAAVGPMQIVGFPVYDGSVPELEWAWANLIAGARMLANYGHAYNGSQPKISAAYNAGPGSVNAHWPSVLQWLEIAGNPGAGTVGDYVANVATWANRYSSKFSAGWQIDVTTGQLIDGKGSATQPTPTLTAPPVPAGIAAQWRGLVAVFRDTIPAKRDEIQSASDALIEVFK